ncbi:MAG: hypothetical protein KA142_13525, partial [Chromatiaceae bacterium]|nr:hypothetical protein [Chromatiaceae bacterium]
MTYQEPVIGTLSPAELEEDRPEPWLTKAPQDPPPAPPAADDPAAEARLLGQSLGALSREDGSAAVTKAPVSGVARPVPPL